MKHIEKKMDVHNILKIKISYPKKEWFMENINFPFKYFEKSYEGEPDITFNFGPFDRKNLNCDIVFRNTEISENYIYFKKKNKGSSYEVEIILDSIGSININFNWIKRSFMDILFPYYRPQLIILEPIIEYKLLLKDWILLHGACIAKKDGAAIFYGRSGSYKSPLVKMFLILFSAKYMGDDKILIKDGYVYSFPKNISMFEYEIFRSHSIAELNKKSEKIRFILYSLMEKKVAHLAVKEKEKVKSLSLLLKSNSNKNNKRIELKKMEYKNVLNSIIYNNYSEFWNYYDVWEHLIAYSYVYTDFPFKNYLNLLNDSVNNNFKNITNLYQITIPINCDKTSIETFLKEEESCF